MVLIKIMRPYQIYNLLLMNIWQQILIGWMWVNKKREVKMTLGFGLSKLVNNAISWDVAAPEKTNLGSWGKRISILDTLHLRWLLSIQAKMLFRYLVLLSRWETIVAWTRNVAVGPREGGRFEKSLKKEQTGLSCCWQVSCEAVQEEPQVSN